MHHAHTITVSLPDGDSTAYYYTATHNHATAHAQHHTHALTFSCSVAKPLDHGRAMPGERVGESEVSAGPGGSRSEFINALGIHGKLDRSLELGVYTVADDGPSTDEDC